MDAQVPGTPPPVEVEQRDALELPVWAFVDAEPEAERDDELAAEESLPEELEPLLEVPLPEPDLDVPLGEPLPVESGSR